MNLVIPLTGLDLFASDIETCKHVSASLGSVVIPLRGLTAAVIQYARKRSCCLTLHVIPATERESPFQKENCCLCNGSLFICKKIIIFYLTF